MDASRSFRAWITPRMRCERIDARNIERNARAIGADFG
jgi:hypothetical protein